jgi:hypothetical protein
MDVDAVAALATTLKSVQTQTDLGTTVEKKVMDMAKTEGDLVLQLMQKAMGIGQNVNISI